MFKEGEVKGKILDSTIRSMKFHKPEIVFKTSTMIYFREVEDFIAYILQTCYKFFRGNAWRYYCREDGRQGRKPCNRLYYLVEACTGDDAVVKLVVGDCTDYSGHGREDMELAEYFIENWLHLHIEERPLSYLLDELKSELWRMMGGKT